MLRTTLENPNIKLVGISVSTSFLCVQQDFHQRLFKKMPRRKYPRTTFSAYTNDKSVYSRIVSEIYVGQAPN